MSIKRENGVRLADICTFRIGGMAREVVTVETEDDLKELFTHIPQGQKWFLLGGGSNIVFPDGDSDTLIIRLGMHGIRLSENGDISIGAAENWDDVVSFAVENGLSGIEALSFIPGTAGATPVQNVGAYGTEIGDTLVSLRAFDTEAKEFVMFSNQDCKFAYRDSIFKHAYAKNGMRRYIITEITLALSRELPDVPQYPGVAEYFAEKDISRPALKNIREAIISIRTKKLPDPREVASVGSFFKNSFIPAEQAQKLKDQYPTLAVFPAGDTHSKVGTGSLIDTLGWKGKRIGNFSLYNGNAMVIVNEGGGTRKELTDVVAMIHDAVLEKYGISIEPEPELLAL